MDIAKNIKIIICDDVRMEQGNKISLMGVYSGSLRVSGLKSILPLLNVVVILEEIKKEFTSINIHYMAPKGKKASEIVIHNNIDKMNTKNQNFITRISPFIIENTGIAEFKVFFKNKDKLLNEKTPIIHNLEIELAKPKK